MHCNPIQKSDPQSIPCIFLLNKIDISVIPLNAYDFFLNITEIFNMQYKLITIMTVENKQKSKGGKSDESRDLRTYC